MGAAYDHSQASVSATRAADHARASLESVGPASLATAQEGTPSPIKRAGPNSVTIADLKTAVSHHMMGRPHPLQRWRGEPCGGERDPAAPRLRGPICLVSSGIHARPEQSVSQAESALLA